MPKITRKQPSPKKPAAQKRQVTKGTPKKEELTPLEKFQLENPTWQARFLTLFANTLNVSSAAYGAGVSRRTIYKERDKSPDFAAALQDAKSEAIERLEAAAYKRAESMSDTLAIFLLKAHKPEVYRERYEATTTNLNLNWDDLTDDELARIAAGEQPARVLADRRK